MNSMTNMYTSVIKLQRRRSVGNIKKKYYTVTFKIMNPEWETIVEADSEQEVHERFHEENTYGKYTDFQVQECIDSLTVADFEISEIKEAY